MTQILFSLNMISTIFTVVRPGTGVVGAGRRDLGRCREARSSRMCRRRCGGTTARAGRRLRALQRHLFRLPGAQGRLVLEGVDLECKPGQLTAIIGPTGSGKSSLASLVPRFYEPTRGEVFLGGQDVREIDLRELRRRIALVPQKTVLFTGTIAENLRWGREDATDAELAEAARLARAHDFVAGFPEGYRTVLGQGGVNLSGGQKQRLAIARALVRKPEVLILDDCTSSVDAITEAEILGGIRGSAASYTCILITQRISAAAAADWVLVLDDGKPVGLGRHETLMRECEVYRDICVAQLGREAVDV